MKDVEIEIQTRVENVAPLLEVLQKEGKQVLDDHQKDEYYTPIHRDFFANKPIDEWLRVRESGKHSITYKNWHHRVDGKSNHCDEFETVVQDAQQIRNIFKVLDIKPVITIDKYRRSWNHDKYEVSIDEIKGLGSFVEVEYKGHGVVDPDQIAKEMIVYLKKMGVGKVEINYVGYPYLLIYGTEGYFEEV
jgi:adenylate cyclase, class 2